MVVIITKVPIGKVTVKVPPPHTHNKVVQNTKAKIGTN